MKTLWCWRCQMEVPMLDEAEFEKAIVLYKSGFTSAKLTRSERFKPLTDYYYDLSGVFIDEPNAIMHHEIALYGPPCENCGKPYRTPRASFCAACGNKR